jgi:serine-type D-Ala-D-Ala endopeptidase (penicillin-binding protein 7)
MRSRSRRASATLTICAALACAATSAPASSTSGSAARPAYQAASTTTTRTPARRSVRRARRAPPGGCYARSAIVVDPATGAILYEKNAEATVPIASITKLMTVLVFLEGKPNLERLADVTGDDLRGAGHTRLRNHERVALGDLLHMTLMCSDNAATRVLVRESSLAPEDFLARMNQKALELGLTHTRYVEFTGLDERNVSTASDVARLLRVAANHPTIQGITTTRSYEFKSTRPYGSRNIPRVHMVANTNRLLYGRYEVLGGKTGFIQESGYCLATWLRAEGHEMIAVVLGAPTNATRFADVMRLVQKTLAANGTLPQS